MSPIHIVHRSRPGRSRPCLFLDRPSCNTVRDPTLPSLSPCPILCSRVTVPPSHHACLSRPKSPRVVPTGSTRSSTTASASWRAATASGCGCTPATAPTSLTGSRALSKRSSNLPVQSCFIDGEAIVVDERGLSAFDLLRSRRYDHAAVFCAFDLVDLDGKDLRPLPIE